MIHPENANAAIDQLIMIAADLGIEAGDIASLAIDEPLDQRLARLEGLGVGLVEVAAAARAILRHRAQGPSPLHE